MTFTPVTDTPSGKVARPAAKSPLALWWAGAAALVGTVALSTVGAAQTGPVAPPAPPAATGEQVAFFESKVRPILVAQCVSCHGGEAQLGGVRLDNAADARKALTPGDPDHSRLIHVLSYTGEIKMPPTGKRPASEIATLTAWVKMGAPWPDSVASKPAADSKALAGAKHWAFQPVVRVAPPKVKNVSWAASPIDRFVLAPLEAKHLTPAPFASRRTLVRRAYFDLVGLPPSPEAVEAFVRDKSPDAWAKVVDGLLASPHYGERWARHWLDVARYADSNGLDENKAFAYAWRYRDYVVNAFNKDKPYDTFLQEQLAGDLLDSGDDEELRNERYTATGFLSLGAKVLAEQDKPKMVMDIVDEQIEVSSKATMGLTIACARCHDHKFDPISTNDYYALAGIFKSTKTMKNLAFVSQWNERQLTTRALTTQIAAYQTTTQPLEANVQAAKARAGAALTATIRADSDKYLRAGWELSRQPGVVLSLAESPPAPGDPTRQVIEAVSFKRGSAVRDTDNYGKDTSGVLVTGKPPVSAEWDVAVPSAGRYQIELRYAAEFARPCLLSINGVVVNKSAAGGVTGSWLADGQRWEVQGVYPFVAGVNRIKLERTDGPIPHFNRLFVALRPRPAEGMAGAKGKTAEQIAKDAGLIPEIVTRWATRLADANTLADAQAHLAGDKTLFALPAKPETHYSARSVAEIKTAETALADAMKAAPVRPTVMAVEDAPKPEDVRVHIRGNTQTLGEVAPRGFPVVLVSACNRARGVAPSAPADISPDATGSGRLAFARWVGSATHPLTARVEVNRVWQHLFGEGLMRTPDNWGVKGDKPTNLPLLDYLASTFVREDGWSRKKLIRRIMLSSAYKMAVETPLMARAAVVDPENRLLWHMSRRRLEAEPLRDSLLSVSGLLDPKMGGSLLNTRDDDYVTDDQSREKAAYTAPRRSIYLPVIRNAVYDLFQAFDFGDGSGVNAHRASTTVAPQALFLMNSPLVQQTSAAFAHDLLTGKNANAPDATRVQTAFARAFARPAAPAEVARATNYLARYEAALVASEPDGAKRRERAWQSYCQALFASNEFCFVD